MTDEELQEAIEVAKESVSGFADNDSLEMLLADAVLELEIRLHIEQECYKNLCEELEAIRRGL
jgi:hypothetical protein